MASMAAGLSLEGFKVFIYSIGVFPTLRCLEQIRNDISYHGCSVTIVTTGAGFSYGSLGMTHHCVQDIGIMRAIPSIDILLCTLFNLALLEMDSLPFFEVSNTMHS